MKFGLSILFGTLAALSTAASAQVGVNASPFDCPTNQLTADVAAAAFSKAQRQYEQTSSFRATFEQRSYLAAVDLGEFSSGEVSFQKPGRMRWHYRSPSEQVFLVRDETLWLHQLPEQQVLIEEFRAVLLTELPVSFLMGIGKLGEGFSVGSACRTPRAVVLTLSPKKIAEQVKSDEGLQSFRLMVRESDGATLGAEVVDIVGNRTEIVLSAIKLNEEIPEKEFAASFPAGTDIVDQRKRRA
jgi:outer membrane lipoprotein carrier protein